MDNQEIMKKKPIILYDVKKELMKNKNLGEFQ